jgi:PPP family 3-phenylpropionic acid transporter
MEVQNTDATLNMADPPSHPRMFLLKAFNFTFFAGLAGLMPFLVLYYEQFGLSGSQIGVLTAIPPFITLFASSVWSAVGDATRQHGRIMWVTVAGAGIFGFLISRATSFSSLIPIVILYAIFIAPIMPLLDNSILGMLGKKATQYGKFRLWGAVGWGAAAPLIGLVVERYGLDWTFPIFLGGMLLTLFVAFFMPVSQKGIGKEFKRGLNILLHDKQLLLFLGTMLVIGVGLGIVDIYLFLRLDEIGTSKALMGFTLTLGTASEIVIFFFTDQLLKRLGTSRLLKIAVGALSLQLIGYSFLTVPWVAPLIQILHGPSFAGMWVAGVTIANKRSPEGMGATTQGLFSSVLFGLGASVGTLIGGYLFDVIGTALTFRLAGMWVFMILVFLILAGRSRWGSVFSVVLSEE